MKALLDRTETWSYVKNELRFIDYLWIQLYYIKLGFLWYFFNGPLKGKEEMITIIILPKLQCLYAVQLLQRLIIYSILFIVLLSL